MTTKKSLSRKVIEKIIPIKSITVSQEYQYRVAGLDKEHLNNMVEALSENSGCLPPVEIVESINNKRYLVDGFHTLEAHKILKFEEIKARIRRGELRDVVFRAARANSQHKGKPRTKDDIRKAITEVVKLLDQDELVTSIRRVASIVGISKSMAHRIMKEIWPHRFGTPQKTENKTEQHPELSFDSRKSIVIDAQQPVRRIVAGKQNSQDTETGDSDTTQDKVSLNNQPEAGSVAPYDWAYHDRIVSAMARIPDNIASSYPNERSSNEFYQSLKAIDHAISALKAWKRKLTGE